MVSLEFVGQHNIEISDSDQKVKEFQLGKIQYLRRKVFIIEISAGIALAKADFYSQRALVT